MIVALVVPALILGKWIEAIFFFFCHWFIREQFKFQYHHILHAICRTLTGVILFAGVCAVLPLAWSLVSAIPICYLVSWVGSVKKQSDLKEIKISELLESLEKLKKKYEKTPEQEMIEKCRKANLSKRDTEVAVKYFVEKQRPKEIWLWLCENREHEYIEWDSVHQLLWRIGKKIK